MIPIRVFALTAVAALTAGGVFATPALASGAPQVAPGGHYCYQTDYADTSRDGNDHFECDYQVTGGTGTISSAYYINGHASWTGSQPASPSGYAFFDVTGLCGYQQTMTVLARFTDSTGAQDSTTDYVTCQDSYFSG